MHDPRTVAFNVKFPWFTTFDYGNGNKHRFWHDFITIWHADPETDGSDDSCGWTYPKLNKEEKDFTKKLAKQEFEFTYKEYIAKGKVSLPEAFSKTCSLFITFNGHYKKRYSLTLEELNYIISVTCHEMDNVSRVFQCDREHDLEYEIETMMCWMLRHWKKMNRHWWQHPKWHFWHWRFQVHPLLEFRRWALSRCSRCGGHFKWGASVTGSWGHEEAPWYKGEIGIWHSSCDRESQLQEEKP